MDNQTMSTEANAYSSPQPSTLIPLVFCLTSFEFLLHPVVFAISLANAALLCRTRLLHANLRFILIAQSASIALFEAMISPSAVKVLFSGDQLTNTIFMEEYAVFPFANRTCLGHVLLLERLLATVYARDYQHFGWKWFTGGWALVVMSLSLANTVSICTSQSPLLVTTVLFIFSSACAILSLLETLAIGLIGAHNLKRYSQKVPKVQEYSLNEKFQLSENIRTSRQLSPAFLCHFLDNMVSLFIIMVLYFEWITRPDLFNVCYSVIVILYSLSGGLISITVITHHPSLKKQFMGVVGRCLPWKRGNRVDDVNAREQPQRRAVTPPKNIHGTALIGKSELDEYFLTLQASWA